MDKKIIDEKNLPDFNEEEAYQELLMILQQAIVMQDFNSVVPLLDAWKRKYPLESFSDVYKRKIKALKDYFEQEYRILLNLSEHKKINTVGAYFELCKIIGNARWDRDLNLAKFKIERWKAKYYTADKQKQFSSSYQCKIRHLTDEKYLFSITEKFDQEGAIEELRSLVEEAKSKKNFGEFEKKYQSWNKQYPYEDFKSSNKTKIDKLLKYEYLPAFEEYQKKLEEATNLGADMSRENPADIDNVISTSILQKSAYLELLKILNNPYNHIGVLDWIYKYRMVQFDDYHKGLIVEKTAPYYKISKDRDSQISDIGTSSDLSYNEFEDMDKTRKLAVTQYFTILHSGRNLGSEDRHRLENVYEKSKKALLVQETYEESDRFEEQEKQSPEISKEDFEEIDTVAEDLFKTNYDDFNGD